eukprot:CAMPEP_0181257312 /NCGR_PEP_ID=MMETSP1096-20121128/50179_1 /TAXON_ID=156174 ORGANISM="Chrysochromulina ericina, Strain CCMP281" /NCGR_SAMPLE_ID=MMETSP1096 /ASSEMBLY_ACC=CAM_ASM_000453 /LENGTH=229 /DNA_ID=CAMNT_0023355625 /DNA_START=84 /DNA_END=773 /DNA_ORIENTATION=+
MNRAKTFRPLRQHSGGTLRLHRLSRSTLGTSNLRAAVALPEGEDVREWISALTIDFFNDINMVFAVAADACTELSCPIMNAGPKIQYKWADGVMKQPTQVSAPKYVDLLMAWVQSQLDDQALFPTKPGDPFPDDFMPRARNVYRRLFRVYAHVFHQHYETIVSNAFEPHLNTCFKHFFYFVLEFDLIQKEELRPLQELIDKLIEEDEVKHASKPAATPAIAPGATPTPT